MRSRMCNPKCKHILCSFASDDCIWYTNRIPVNLLAPTATRPTCSCQDLSWLCHHHGGVVFFSWVFSWFFSWRRGFLFMILFMWFSFHDVVLGAIASTWPTYMTAIKLSDLMKGECPTPSSAKATVNIDHNSNIKNAWNNNIIRSIKACSVPSRRSTSIKRDRRSFALLKWW